MFIITTLGCLHISILQLAIMLELELGKIFLIRRMTTRKPIYQIQSKTVWKLKIVCNEFDKSRY